MVFKRSLKEQVKKVKKKGFTLIELIVVIAVLGILVLLAAPKFLGHTAEAKLAQIKADTKTYENVVTAELVSDEELMEDWEIISPEDLEEINASNKVIDKKGNIVSNLGGENYIIDREDLEVKSDLKGKFILTPNEQVVYYDENLMINPNEIGNGSNNESGENGEVAEDGSGDGSGSGEQLEFTPDENFSWVEATTGYEAAGQAKKGYYSYTGTGEETVVIPHEINGTPITSYMRMFSNTGADVKKVVSTNPNVTNMNWMFTGTLATELDLSEFDTSGVDRMQAMFQNSKATTLDLSNWDTSNVISMYSMFQNSAANKLDLSSFTTPLVGDMSNMFNGAAATVIDVSSFNTSATKNMSYMFYNTKAENLDLSGFYTTSAVDLNSMFAGSAATVLDLSNFEVNKLTNSAVMAMFQGAKATTGYAKNATEAAKLNSIYGKPTYLTFTTK